jgi:integrase
MLAVPNSSAGTSRFGGTQGMAANRWRPNDQPQSGCGTQDLESRRALVARRRLESNAAGAGAAHPARTKRRGTQTLPDRLAEQRLLFSELAPHLQRIALFKVNTGVRARELYSLRWEWEQRIPELDTPEMKRTVFVLPETVTKNQEARVVVLNDIAQSIVEEVRGQHPTYVFTWLNREGRRRPLTRLTNSGWRSARRRAAARYERELSRPLPPGFRKLRVHDLRHTFGRRLRAVGAGLEDRQDLLGHKSGRMTTHYSAAEIGNLLTAGFWCIGGSPERALPPDRLTAF